MRFKRHLQLEQGLKGIDIVPLINVVFLLLIFLMLGSSFVVQSGMKVNLPKTVTSEVIGYQNIEIVVSSDNAIYLNNQVINLQELRVSLEQISKRKGTILIKADKGASLGRVVQIWDLCRESGIAQINIATN
jgi:biopolymer transport protein ExbD